MIETKLRIYDATTPRSGLFMQIESFKAVAFTAAFLMPGFIWSAVLSLMLPRRSGQSEQRFLEFFTLSCVNNAVWFSLFLYFYLIGYPSQRPGAFAFFVRLANKSSMRDVFLRSICALFVGLSLPSMVFGAIRGLASCCIYI